MTAPATDWTFAGAGNWFDGHVAAHLPVYGEVQRIIADVSTSVIAPGGHVVDLGASTGRTIADIAAVVPSRRITADLYDADASMLDAAAERLAGHPNVEATFHQRDITDPAAVSHHDADLTIAAWITQFLHPARRVGVLASARAASTPGGAILVASKIRHTDPRWQDIADGCLADAKAAAGVTGEEIVAKSRSLRGVMIPDSIGGVSRQLVDAGWHAPCVLHAWHGWALIGAWAMPVAGMGDI